MVEVTRHVKSGSFRCGFGDCILGSGETLSGVEDIYIYIKA